MLNQVKNFEIVFSQTVRTGLNGIPGRPVQGIFNNCHIKIDFLKEFC